MNLINIMFDEHYSVGHQRQGRSKAALPPGPSEALTESQCHTGQEHRRWVRLQRPSPSTPTAWVRDVGTSLHLLVPHFVFAVQGY